MNKIIILFFSILSVALVQSCTGHDKKEVSQEVSQEEILADCRKSYDYYCYIRENIWGSFDEYMSFISVDKNKEKFDSCLKERGYDRWDSVDISWSLDGLNDCLFATTDYIPEDIGYKNEYIAWLYVKLHDKGIDTLSYIDFKNKVLDKDGFVWCYEISKENGFVDTWMQFINLMLECKLEYTEE